jgi:hypothetical protein
VLTCRRSNGLDRIKRFGAMLLLSAAAGCQRNSGSAPAAAPPPMTPIVTANILKALDNPTEWDSVYCPLKDVVNALQIRHGIKIDLDVATIEKAGVSRDTPITYKAKDLSLNVLLRQLLQKRGLSYVIDNGVLLITTAERAREKETRSSNGAHEIH